MPSERLLDARVPRRPGRPVSAASRNAVLAAATALLDEHGLDGFSVDEVARRSGVSKATIYKHWSGGLEIALEAYGSVVSARAPVPSTGDVMADLTEQVRRVAAVYAGPRGRVLAQVLAAGSHGADSVDAEMLRSRYFGQRREETAALIAQGVADGSLRPGFDAELIIDLLFGPIVFRLFNGGRPLDADDAAALADLALRGLAMPLPSLRDHARRPNNT